MKDISKCPGTNCKKAETCLRFTQPPKAKYQSYLNMSTSIKVVDECRFHMEIK